MKNQMPIGIFDSGVGGLSAVREIRKLLPNEDLIYFGDTARIPYGTRSVETIKKYARQDAEFLLSKKVKVILSACGTVSSIALDYLKEICDVPVMGVVAPAAKKAVTLTTNGKVGVFGTSATINSAAYSKAMKSYKNSLEIVEKACPLLVPLVENGYITSDSEITRLALREYLVPMKENGVDTLILGCTHYPLISKLIIEEWGKDSVIDTGREAAIALSELINAEGLETDKNEGGSLTVYSSDNLCDFEKQAELFLPTQSAIFADKIDIGVY